MESVVSITSQRQIYIPVPMYQALNLSQYKKASIKIRQNQLIVEPLPDVMDLAGKLNGYAFKNKSAREILAGEEKVLGRVFSGK